jgi:UDP:flavonoid glycosyltransferase YjiC (YdhE family)
VALAYCAPYGVGLGHASRLVLLADRLASQGIKARFSTFGEAASYVSMKGYQCSQVPPVEFAWSLEGGLSIKHSIGHIPLWFSNFSRQVAAETKNMSAYAPDIVVSDSRLSPLVASRILSIPSIVILNQVKLLLSPRLREVAVARLFEDLVAEFLANMWNAAERILVPDLPPPYTISANNLWEIKSAKLEYIGFTSPKPHIDKENIEKVTKRLGFNKSKPIVFAHISGPAPTRAPLLKKIASSLKDLDGIQSVISEGKPDGETEPKPIGEHSWYYEWCPIRDELFYISDLLLLRGGHATLSQALQFGKPIVTIPIENHGEQLGNSAKVQQMGAGIMLEPNGLTPSLISKAILTVLADPKFSQKAKEAMELSLSMDGIDYLVSLVKHYC